MFGWSIKKESKSVEPHVMENMNENIKRIVIESLHDEGLVTAFADEIYMSLMKKMAGYMGGTQKGLNASVESNPIMGIFDKNGNPSVKGIIGAYLSGKLMGSQKQEEHHGLP